ncbi:hypothetical protein [Amycolatopsis sp. NPDC051371]
MTVLANIGLPHAPRGIGQTGTDLPVDAAAAPISLFRALEGAQP